MEQDSDATGQVGGGGSPLAAHIKTKIIKMAVTCPSCSALSRSPGSETRRHERPTSVSGTGCHRRSSSLGPWCAVTCKQFNTDERKSDRGNEAWIYNCKIHF